MRTIQITFPPEGDKIEAIINPRRKSVERMPDHRFCRPYEEVEAIHPELKAQIELLISRVRQAVQGEDPILRAYEDDNLFVEEVSSEPADFKVGDLLSFINSERATSGVHPHHYDASPRDTYGSEFSRNSVIAYAFMNAEGTRKPFKFKDEDAYATYRMQLIRDERFQFYKMFPYSDVGGIHRGFPMVFLVPIHIASDRYLATRAEHELYAKMRTGSSERRRYSEW